MTKVTVGADPEVFLGKGGEFVCAHGLLPGDKEDPFPVEGGAVQVDGMAAEFNINPVSTQQDFINTINLVQQQLHDMIDDKDFLKCSSVNFSEKFMEEVPIQAKILGCELDFDAYTMRPNPKPDGDLLMRTAGGHVHIGGFEEEAPEAPWHMELCSNLVKQLDAKLGVYSLLWDRDTKRRDMYGKAGAFRPKTYGCEYRTLSNAWIFNSYIVGFVYDAVQEAVEAFLGGEEVDPDMKNIINQSEYDSNFFKGNKTAEKLLDNGFCLGV